MRRRPLLIALALVVATAGWYAWWRSPEVQTRALLARITAAVEAGDGGALVRELHPRYDARTALRRQLGGDDNDLQGLGDLAAQRPVLAQAATAVLERWRGDPLRLTWRIDQLEDGDDGEIRALVSLDAATRSGEAGPLPAPLRRFLLVLARDGWLPPRLRVLRHDPLPIDP